VVPQGGVAFTAMGGGGGEREGTSKLVVGMVVGRRAEWACARDEPATHWRETREGVTYE